MNKKIKIPLLIILPVIMVAAMSLHLTLSATYSKGRTSYPEIDPMWLTVDSIGRVWTANGNQFSGGVSQHTIILQAFDNDTWRTYKQNYSIGSPISALASDQQGNIWVGTFDAGLVKFNGVTWQVFTTANSGLASNLIDYLSCDHLGHLWIAYDYSPTGSPNSPKGVTMFDGSRWKTFTVKNSGLSSNEVQTIAFDSQNRAWIGLSGGISIFDGDTWTTLSPDNSEMKADKISAIAFDKEGRAWIGTYGEVEGVSVFDGTNWTFFSPESMGFPSWSYSNSAYSWIIPKILIDETGSVWVYGFKGTRIFDGNSWIPFIDLDGRNIRSVSVDQQGRTWVILGGGKENFFSLDPDYPLNSVLRCLILTNFLSSGGIWYVAFVLTCLFIAVIFDVFPIISFGMLGGFLITILFGKFQLPVIGIPMNPGVFVTVSGLIGAVIGLKMAAHAKKPKRTRVLAIIISSLIGIMIGICQLAPFLFSG